MFTYIIRSAFYSPVSATGNENDFPNVFIRGSVEGDIALLGNRGGVSNYFTWKQIEVAYSVGGVAAVRLNLAPAMFAAAFWPPPYVDNEGEPIEPSLFPNPPYEASVFKKPEQPNGSNLSVVCYEALACGTWTQ